MTNSAMQNATGWLSITKAPQDQRPILAAHETGGMQAVSWRVRPGTTPVYRRYADDEGWRPTHFKHLGPPPEKPHAE